MHSNTVEIASPCHESWEAMQGEGARRFCGVCQKDVHDLSAMAQAEAQALLREQSGGSLCVRYTAEVDGTLRFRDLVPKASLTRKIVRTAFAASMLAACTPYSEGPAVQDLGASILDSIRDATVPTADGGCDYTTGPFTTFHLPAGHAFCQPGSDVVPAPPEPMSMGSIGAGAVMEEPPSDEYIPAENELPWVHPESEPEPEPEPEPDPDATPPRMGQAVAQPELVDPLVPCDPKPAVEPKPEHEPRTMPIKGRMKVQPPAPKPKHTMGVMIRNDDDI